jgi:alpha-L-fucosidase
MPQEVIAFQEAVVESPPAGAWFPAAKYGLFLHWGLYSLLGRGEWVRNRERIPDEEYRSLAEQFTVPEFDARAWARFAVESGMRYAVLTAKHHDGFCMWNSQTCAFNSVNSAARRDIVGEYAQAFREAGLKVGIYYSLGDWQNPDWIRAVRGDEAARFRFVSYTRSLLAELLTGYGPIDVLWYDLPQGLSAEEWEARSLNAMARKLQPSILINNRSMLAEDFSVLEQTLHSPPAGRLWETCLTLNESWAYVPADHDYKSPRQVVRSLVRAAAGGGNLLLNVGPTGQGAIPTESRRILAEVANWLDRNGQAVFGVTGGGLPFNLWGATTVRDHEMFLFLERYNGSEVVIGGLKPNALSAHVLGTGERLSIERNGTRTTVRGLPATSPDPLVPVICVSLDGPPAQDTSEVIGGADIMASFPD